MSTCGYSTTWRHNLPLKALSCACALCNPKASQIFNQWQLVHKDEYTKKKWQYVTISNWKDPLKDLGGCFRAPLAVSPCGHGIECASDKSKCQTRLWQAEISGKQSKKLRVDLLGAIQNCQELSRATQNCQDTPKSSSKLTRTNRSCQPIFPKLPEVAQRC